MPPESENSVPLMDDTLEVFFCDVCNASVPQADLDSRDAVRVKGKVLGKCCLAGIHGSDGMSKNPSPPSSAAGPVPTSSGRGGVAGATVILLAAVAGGAMFLDWRLSEEVSTISNEVRLLNVEAREQKGRLVLLKEKLGSALTMRDLAGIEESVAALPQMVAASEEKLRGRIDGSSMRFDELGRGIEELKANQLRQESTDQRLTREVRLLGEEVSAAMARARPAPIEVDPASEDPPDMTTDLVNADAEVPAELSHHVSKLSDSDPGARFEAVDKLIQSRDPSILDKLVAMTKDADPFVRRLTVEGLSDFRKAVSIEALLTALADAESIVRHAAYSSLRKLTGEDIAFDPDARKDERRAAQRRWQDWWRKSKFGF